LPSNIEIDIDESIVFTTQFTPTNATITSLTWTVGNNQIALVNAWEK
jgi:molybdopterin-binding protein